MASCLVWSRLNLVATRCHCLSLYLTLSQDSFALLYTIILLRSMCFEPSKEYYSSLERCSAGARAILTAPKSEYPTHKQLKQLPTN